MEVHIYSHVETNIDENSEMYRRLQEVNSFLDKPHVVIEYKRSRSRGWFRKPEEYTVYDIIDTGDTNCILVENTDERGVELYLLGMINGHKAHTLNLIKKDKAGNEVRIPDGSLVREDLTGRKYIVESSTETNNQFGYGVYLYKMVDGPIPTFGLYRREFTVLRKGKL